MNKKAKKVVICGYYGRGNFGDEAILRVILRKINDLNNPNPIPGTPKGRLSLKSKSATKRRALDIRVLKSKNLFSAVRDMAGADAFVFGGGSILQNATSDVSLLYYLLIIRLSNVLCKRKIMLSNGIGPIIERKIPKKVLLSAISDTANCFDFISVRDTDSRKLLRTILPHREIHLIPDPTLISFSKNQPMVDNADKNEFFVYVPQAHSIAKHQISITDLIKSLAFLSSKFDAQIKIAILNENEDYQIAHRLAFSLKNATISVLNDEIQAAQAFKGTKFVISSRYHGSMLAAVMGIPTVSISNDPKIGALCKDFSLFPIASPEILKNADSLLAHTEKALDFHAKNYQKSNKLIQTATQNANQSLETTLKF